MWPSSVRAASAPLFDAFPNVDARQHSVYDAEVLQIVGTVDGAALLAALGASGDRRWWPLTISGARSLLSIGVGDFLDTSGGAYRELAIAFPACEAATVGSTLPPLTCASFAACQVELPDCTHTYMFVSFVTQATMLQHIREGGVDAVHAGSFDLLRAADHTVKFDVRGPDGAAVLSGAVQTAAPETSLLGDLLSGPAPAPPGRGHSLQPFVGRPGVAGPGQARHICVFESGVTVNAARIAGPLELGELLQSLDFSVEGAFHLPALRLVRLPAWGAGSGGGSAEAANDTTAAGSADAKGAKGFSSPDVAAADAQRLVRSWHSVAQRVQVESPPEAGSLDAAATAATLQRLSPGRSWGVGDAVTVKGRRGVISWDGRPAHNFVKLRWDNGDRSDMVPAGDVRPVVPEPVATVRAAGSTGTPLTEVAHLLDKSVVGQAAPVGARRPSSAGNAAVLGEL